MTFDVVVEGHAQATTAGGSRVMRGQLERLQELTGLCRPEAEATR